MTTIREVINRILWSGEDVGRYELIIEDRLTGSGYRKLPLSKVKRVDKHYIYVESYGGVTPIPIHRVRAVLKDGELYWSR